MTREEAAGLWTVQLLESATRDGMAVREVSMPTPEVVLFKSLIEAHPGVAAVHALPGRVRGARAELCVATTRELEPELDAVLAELTEEIPALVSRPWNSQAGSEVVGGGAGE
jgi:hypothetical protein